MYNECFRGMSSTILWMGRIDNMNIIYMHTHDSGRYIQPYGYPVSTPNMMRLAQESTLFRKAFCAGPTCSPSRAALLTGACPHRNGMLGLASRGFALNDYDMHMVRWLSKHGFRTALCGIQHEGMNGATIGYDEVLIEPVEKNMYIKDAESFDHNSARLAADYLRKQGEKKGSFFLSFGMINTHRDFPIDDKSTNPDYVIPPPTLYDCAQTREDMARFMNSARIADECLGVVLNAVRESGLEDNTIVLFTTDHGIAFPFMKCTLYDTGIGVALMIKYPGNPLRGKVTDALVSQIDIFPTLCDLCGIEKPDWLEGESMVNILSGDENVHGRSEVFSEVTYHASYEPMRCVRTERYKLIRRYDFHNCIVPSNIDNSLSKQFVLDAGILDRVNAREMLFDLYLDPMERENLVDNADYKDIYNDLSNRLSEWMKQTDDPLLRYGHRIPAPEGAAINKLSCLHAEYDDFE